MALNLALGLALGGLSSLAGLFSKPKNTAQIDVTRTSSPDLDPTTLNFRDMLINSFTNSLDDGGQFEDAYKVGGLNNLRKASANNNAALQDILTSRGINRTSAGGSAAFDNSFRSASGVADFLNNLPIIMDQRRQALRSSAGQFFSAIPYGTTQTEKGTVPAQGYNPGGFGAAVSGGAQGLATYLGQKAAIDNWTNAMKNLPKTTGG